MIIQTTYTIIDLINDIELEVSHEIDSQFIKIKENVQGQKNNEIALSYEQAESLLTVLLRLRPEINNKNT